MESPSPDIDQIKNMIGDGRTEDAIDLMLRTADLPAEIHQSALLLRNRWHTLEKEIIEGIIDRRDINLEKSRIAHSLLQLVESSTKSVSQDDNTQERSPLKSKGASPTLSPKISLFLFVFVVIAILSIYHLTSQVDTQEQSKLKTISLKFVSQGLPDVYPLGILSLHTQPDTALSLQLTKAEQVFATKMLPQRLHLDSLQIDLSLLNYRYAASAIETTATEDTLHATIYLQQDTMQLRGQLLYSDRRAASGLRIVFGDTVASATSGPDGTYTTVLPRPQSVRNILVRLYQGEEEIYRRRLLLDQAVLSKIEIRR